MEEMPGHCGGMGLEWMSMDSGWGLSGCEGLEDLMIKKTSGMKVKFQRIKWAL